MKVKMATYLWYLEDNLYGIALQPLDECTGRGGIGGLVVRVLTWNMTGVGLTPTQSHTFPSINGCFI